MTKLLSVLLLSLSLLATLASAKLSAFHSIPENDRSTLARVASAYNLTPDERKLLFTIRLVENGGPGREMGVLTQNAQRYRGDHAKSLELQASYAAGTIKKRYSGDLASFANQWAPIGVANDPTNLNKNWLANASKIMQEN